MSRAARKTAIWEMVSRSITVKLIVGIQMEESIPRAKT